MEERWSWGEGKFVAGEVHVRVRYAYMSYQCVAPAESLFFRAQMARNLLLARGFETCHLPQHWIFGQKKAVEGQPTNQAEIETDTD